jgi:hypothetical protein
MTRIYCPTCRDQRPVEQPPCVDGHADCPEWICLDCDTVIVAGWSVVDAPHRDARLIHAA